MPGIGLLLEKLASKCFNVDQSLKSARFRNYTFDIFLVFISKTAGRAHVCSCDDADVKPNSFCF